MSRMFHRALVVSVIGTAALALPAVAMAADSGAAAPETATSVVIHLPQRAQPGEPFKVTARVIPHAQTPDPGAADGTADNGVAGGATGSGDTGDSAGAPDPTADQPVGRPEAQRVTDGTDPGQSDTGTAKGTGHRKGKGHHKGKTKGTAKGKGKTKRHAAMTGEVTFTLDGKAQPPVAVHRGQAVEEIEVPLGRHTISAEYSGDAHFESADSPTVTFALTDNPPQPTENTRR